VGEGVALSGKWEHKGESYESIFIKDSIRNRLPPKFLLLDIQVALTSMGVYTMFL
jgi:hypothetical protein